MNFLSGVQGYNMKFWCEDMGKREIGLAVGLFVATVALTVLAFKRRRYREAQKQDNDGAYWAAIHMLVLLIIVAPVSYALFGTLVLSLFEGDWQRFVLGIWVLLVILISCDLGFELAEKKTGRSFADSIDKISKIESHLMNFLAVAGFYSSVIARGLDKNAAWELNYYLLFGALIVFLDLVVLNIYENLYLLRGKEKPGDTQ